MGNKVYQNDCKQEKDKNSAREQNTDGNSSGKVKMGITKGTEELKK